jgi:hypothetical protein
MTEFVSPGFVMNGDVARTLWQLQARHPMSVFWIEPIEGERGNYEDFKVVFHDQHDEREIACFIVNWKGDFVADPEFVPVPEF